MIRITKKPVAKVEDDWSDKPKMTSLGVDLSCTATGLVLLRENGTPIPETVLHQEIKPGDRRGVERCVFVNAKVLAVIAEHVPTKIVVEGYSLNTKNASSIIPLVEIGGMLRFMLWQAGYAWYDPRATEVKQFATGKGGSAKSLVLMNVLKRWGFEASSDNEADAYALAAMGLAHSNRLPGINQAMRGVVGTMVLRKN